MTAPDHIQQQKINRITDQVKRTFFTVSMDSWNCPWADVRIARGWPIRTARWRT